MGRRVRTGCALVHSLVRYLRADFSPVNEVTFVRRRIIFETYVGLPFPSIIQRREQKLDVHRQAGLVNRSVALRLINRLIDRLDDAALGAFDTSSVDGCFHHSCADRSCFSNADGAGRFS